jgi:hypothetical protein
MEKDIENDEAIFAQGKHGVNARFTIAIVPVEKVHGQKQGNDRTSATKDFVLEGEFALKI